MPKEWWQQISADLHLKLLENHGVDQTSEEISFVESQAGLLVLGKKK